MNSSFILLASILILLSGFLLSVKFSHKIHLENTMRKKLVTWWIIVASILLAGQLSIGLPFLIAATIFSCVYEIYVITNQRRTHLIFLAALIIFLMQYSIYYSYWADSALLFFIVFLLLKSFNNKQKNDHLVFLFASFIAIVGLSITSLILALSIGNTKEGAMGTLLFLVFISQGNDIAQYSWGKSLGKSKIAPSISPNKTWAGFIGGLITFTGVGYWIGSSLTSMNAMQSAWAAIIICILGLLGDLLVSYLKRSYQLKDTGTMLPGHGGMGDRIDSLLLSSPGYFLYLLVFIDSF